MEKKRNMGKIVLIVVIIVAVLVGAFLLYKSLTKPEPTENQDLPSKTKEAAELEDEQESSEAEKETPKLPDFTIYDNQGNEVKLSEKVAGGKALVLNFWASWCGPCQMEMGSFEKAYDQYGDRVEFMMINLTDGSRETVDKASEFIEDNGYTFPVYYDEDQDAARIVGVSSIPLSLFVDSQGNVLDAHMGAMTSNMLDEAIQNLLGA